MAHYKIINITGKLGKRHVDKDTILNIEYHVGFQKKYRKLGVNSEMLLTCRTLPVSIHTLRAKNLIIISEISENEFVKLQKPSARPQNPKKVEEKEEVIIIEEDIKDIIITTPKKKVTKSNIEKESTVIIKE